MRIRTIKPEFFIDEDLQDLEADNPGKYVMLVFAGLWGNCDKQGVFEWRPRILNLHILPFLKFDMEATLNILTEAEIIIPFVVDGKKYGFIPTFTTHQRITGKEGTEPAKLPSYPGKIEPGPSGDTPGTQQGKDRDTVGMTGREGKGREKEGKGKPAREQSQSGVTGPDLTPKAGGQAGVTLSERSLRKCVEEQRDWLQKNFPDVDIGLETEELVAKYRRETIGTDPWLLVLRWFRNLGSGVGTRASPEGVAAGSLAEATRAANKQACRDFAGGGADG